VEVYFDGAPPSQAGTRRQGLVTAHFVPLGTTADNAIRRRLNKLGKSAKNWTVVSSDRQVQTEARSARADVQSSDEFARKLKRARDSAPKPASERQLSKHEVDDWLEIFKDGKNK
jgi:predicted RNA-binding protein with PIN domain